MEGVGTQKHLRHDLLLIILDESQGRGGDKPEKTIHCKAEKKEMLNGKSSKGSLRVQ